MQQQSANATLQDVQTLIQEREQAQLHRPLVIAIDGQSGSGKSTFAQLLLQKFGDGAVVVQGDDFYRDMPEEERAQLSPAEGYDKYFDWPRLLDQVLEPARRGDTMLRYQKYDWVGATMGECVECRMPEILILEGVYSLRPEFEQAVEIKIFVETREAVRMERQIDRGENEDLWIERWAAAEEYYIAKVDPKSHADLILLGDVPHSQS